MPIFPPGAVIPFLRAMPNIPSSLLHESTFPSIRRSERSQHHLGQARDHIPIIARPAAWEVPAKRHSYRYTNFEGKTIEVVINEPDDATPEYEEYRRRVGLSF